MDVTFTDHPAPTVAFLQPVALAHLEGGSFKTSSSEDEIPTQSFHWAQSSLKTASS